MYRKRTQQWFSDFLAVHHGIFSEYIADLNIWTTILLKLAKKLEKNRKFPQFYYQKIPLKEIASIGPSKNDLRAAPEEIAEN